MRKKIMMFFALAALVFSEDKRIGLVLSGGTAKGLAHIGILKVLEEENQYITFEALGDDEKGIDVWIGKKWDNRL